MLLTHFIEVNLLMTLSFTYQLSDDFRVPICTSMHLLLDYDQQIHTCSMSDHQKVMINFMYMKNIVYIKIKYSHYTTYSFFASMKNGISTNVR